jgi:RNase P/RNase MRP subunit POP5
VVFRIESETSFTEPGVADALATSFVGRVPRLVVFRDNSGIVRCLNTTKDETIRALNAMHAIGKKQVVVRTLGTSGTIRKAREKYLS